MYPATRLPLLPERPSDFPIALVKALDNLAFSSHFNLNLDTFIAVKGRKFIGCVATCFLLDRSKPKLRKLTGIGDIGFGKDNLNALLQHVSNETGHPASDLKVLMNRIDKFQRSGEASTLQDLYEFRNWHPDVPEPDSKLHFCKERSLTLTKTAWIDWSGKLKNVGL